MSRKSSRWPEGYTENPPPWLPDWKNPAAYSIPETVQEEDIYRYYSWQFLRRNYEYQQTYYETLEAAEMFDESVGNTPSRGYVKRRGIENYTEEIDDEEFEKHLTEVSERFLLKGFIADPAYNNFLMAPMINGHNIKRPPWSQFYHSDILDNISALEVFHRLIEIDLRYPLQPQLNRAKHDLKKEQAGFLNGYEPLWPASKKYNNEIITKVLLETDPSLNWRPKTGKEFKKLCLVKLHVCLDRQLKFHEESLEALQSLYLGKVLQPTWNKRKPASLTRYLRILDAISLGAAPLEIKAEFFSDKETVTYVNTDVRSYKGTYSQQDSCYRTALKEAKLLCSVGWRSLLN